MILAGIWHWNEVILRYAGPGHRRRCQSGLFLKVKGTPSGVLTLPSMMSNLPTPLQETLPFVGNEKIRMSLKSTGLLRDTISIVQVKRILNDFSDYDAFL